MARKTLTVELSGELYTAFMDTITEKEGRWRGKETSTEAVESAVTAALMLFLQNLTERQNRRIFAVTSRESTRGWMKT